MKRQTQVVTKCAGLSREVKFDLTTWLNGVKFAKQMLSASIKTRL